MSKCRLEIEYFCDDLTLVDAAQVRWQISSMNIFESITQIVLQTETMLYGGVHFLNFHIDLKIYCNLRQNIWS